jgi:hypothetical protein
MLSITPILRAETANTKLEAKVGLYKGRNVFFVNGKPMPPLMYSGTEGSRETWTGRPRQSVEEFAALGYEIFQTDMWFKYSLKPDGSFDLEGIRKQLAGILQVKPDAKIVVRINVSAPRWWLNQNPAELCRITEPSPNKVVFGGNTAESLASESYRAFAAKYLKLFLQQLEMTPEGDRVIGFHIGGGVYGEWHYYGIYQEPDASEPMRKQFLAFARTKYVTLDKINLAWRTHFETFDHVVVPSYDRRYRVSDGDFRDPQEDRCVIDYYECQHATVASLVNGLAKLTKETWSRPTLVGLFYGYFHGNWTVGAQASQFDIQTLFRSPYVDYFSGPYSSRNMFGSGYFRTLANSVSLNGKVWLTEHDGGTHLGNVSNSTFPDIPGDEPQSIARMRRNFMYTLTDNAGQWWYDFGPKGKSGWWSTPAMLAEARKLLALSQSSLEKPYEKPSDVLVVHDMKAFDYVRPARVDQLTFKITQDMCDTLLGTGAAFDRIFLMDLPRVDLAKYKLIIFGNTFLLPEAERTYIRAQVIKDGRSVVFMSGAGYSDGTRNDVALISSLVGMRIEKAKDVSPVANASLNGQAYKLDARGVTSLFQVKDTAAQPLATYSSGQVAAAEKTINGCRVSYFGLPLNADIPFFTDLLARFGVRTYIENTVHEDYVAVGGGLLAIYSVQGGEKLLKPLKAAPRKVLLQPFSTRYFDLATGADKL